MGPKGKTISKGGGIQREGAMRGSQYVGSKGKIRELLK